MKQTLLFIVFLFSLTIHGQESNIDAIIVQLKQKINHSEKTEKLKWMDSMSNTIAYDTAFENDSILKETVRYAIELDSFNIAAWQTANLIYFQNNIKGNPKEGNRLFEESLEYINKVKNYKTLAKLYLEGADSYYFLEDHLASITYYDLAEENAVKGNHKKYVGLAKLYKGGTLSFLGKFSEASQVLQEAAKVFQETKDSFNILGAKNSLSILYSQNAFFKEAEAERDDAIILAKQLGSNGHLTSYYYNAATDARKQNLEMERVEYLKLAYNASKKTHNASFYEAMMLSSLSIAYANMDSISRAEYYLKELEKTPGNTVGNNYEPYLDARKHLAFAKKDYGKALQLGKEHLNIKKSGTHYEEIQEGEHFLYKVYEQIGNNEAAFVHFKKFTNFKDSINDIRKVKALSYYQTLYETEKRDAKITAQKKDIALLDAKNRIQNQLILFGGLGLLAIFSTVILLRSRNAARRRQVLQEGFSQDLIKAQEEERTRVARELHDSVGQKLMLLTKQTKSSGNIEMESLADNTLDELRSISRGLHPATLEKLGVTAAIKSMINEVDANTNIFFTNEIAEIDNMLSKESSLHLYRILQEVLNNMVKHSEAKAASVTIETKGKTITAVIKDNGKGFEFSENMKKTASLGMKTLLERAKIIKSTLDIKSRINQGTTIQLIIPSSYDS